LFVNPLAHTGVRWNTRERRCKLSKRDGEAASSALDTRAICPSFRLVANTSWHEEPKVAQTSPWSLLGRKVPIHLLQMARPPWQAAIGSGKHCVDGFWTSISAVGRSAIQTKSPSKSSLLCRCATLKHLNNQSAY
jgi:hypothetical protein